MNHDQIKKFIEQHPDTKIFKTDENTKERNTGEISNLIRDLPDIKPQWIEIVYDILTSDKSNDILKKYSTHLE